MIRFVDAAVGWLFGAAGFVVGFTRALFWRIAAWLIWLAGIGGILWWVWRHGR